MIKAMIGVACVMASLLMMHSGGLWWLLAPPVGLAGLWLFVTNFISGARR